MQEREIVTERPVADREIVIDERPARGGGGAVAAIIGILLVLLLGWFLLNALGILDDALDDGAASEVDANVQLDDPEG